jgi:hypothetical protein
MKSPSAEHYLKWAKPFHTAVAGNLHAIKGDLYHLWHGEALQTPSLRVSSQILSTPILPQMQWEEAVQRYR